MSDAVTQNPPKASKFKFSDIGEIAIEITDERNRNVAWPPTKQMLRGAWKRGNLVGITMHVTMSQMPDIPGMHIVLDCRKRVQSVLDPLNAPRNKTLLEAIQAVHVEAFRQKAGPEKDIVEDNLNETKMKTCLYWMRRLVDAGHARVVSGELPDNDVIEAMPGMTRVESWNSSARARKYREEEDLDVAQRNEMKPGY